MRKINLRFQLIFISITNRVRDKWYCAGIGLVMLFFCSTLHSQTTTISEFLSKAQTEKELLLHQRKLDYLKNTDHSMPWADQLEFRTETDEMNLGRQEYLTRFRFNPKAERQAFKKIHSSNIQSEEIEKTLILSDALMERYFIVLDYAVLNKWIGLKKKEQEITADKITVLKRKAINSSDNFNINDLLKAEDEAHEIEQEILKLENEIAFIENGLSGKLDASNLITVNEIFETAGQFSALSASNRNLLERQINIEQNNLEYDLEKAENNWNIDYVQFKYSGREKLGFGQEWSFGLGIEIPLKESGRLENNKFQLEKIDLENRLEMEHFTLQEQIQKTAQELEIKKNQYDLIGRQLEESQLLYSSENYSQHKDADPYVLLNIQSYLMKKEADKQKIEEDIYSIYLELLELSGKVVEVPLRNYLSSDSELLSN